MDPVTLIDLGLSMFAASFLVEDEEPEEENCFVWEFDSEEWDYLLIKSSTTVITPRNVHFITQRWADIFLVFSSIWFRYSTFDNNLLLSKSFAISLFEVCMRCRGTVLRPHRRSMDGSENNSWVIWISRRIEV